jgi:hypothetical protein
MQMLDGALVDPDAAGCCAGVGGSGPGGYRPCASAPTTSGLLYDATTDEARHAFTCDRHAVVLRLPRPLTDDDLDELARRASAGRRARSPS